MCLIKTVAVANDLSSFGNCSLTAAVAILAAMGHRPCPLPTAVLSAQSEFPSFYEKDLTASMPHYLDAWEANHERFDGICTGYFARGGQLDHAAALLTRFRRDSTLTLVDPVMGDGGALYPGYDRSACAKMKELAARADVLTPNLTELCILTGAEYHAVTAHRGEADYFERIATLALPLAAGRGVIVTGVADGGEIGNLVLSGGERRVIRTKRMGGRFSGTGDIFAAVVCGSMLRGDALFTAAETAARFIGQAIADTVQSPHLGRYGVNYEKFLGNLTR